MELNEIVKFIFYEGYARETIGPVDALTEEDMKDFKAKLKQWMLERLPSENTSVLFSSDYKNGFLDCLTKAQVNIKND